MHHLQPTDFDASNCSLCASTKLAGRWVLPAQSSSTTAAHRRLRANTSGKIKRSSCCYYPRRYRLQLFRTATAGCSCTPRNLNRNRFWEKCFRWHNPSLGRRDRDGGEQTTSLHKTESPSKVFMCGVSTQKWPSNQITMFERTRQSAWFNAVTTPLTRSE